MLNMAIPPEMLRHLRHLEGYDRSPEWIAWRDCTAPLRRQSNGSSRPSNPWRSQLSDPTHPNLERSCHSRMEGPIGPYTTRVQMRSVARP